MKEIENDAKTDEEPKGNKSVPEVSENLKDLSFRFRNQINTEGQCDNNGYGRW
jgi:hypothetical protein